MMTEHRAVPALFCVWLLFLCPRIGSAVGLSQESPPVAVSQEMNQAQLVDAFMKDPNNEDRCYQVMALFFEQQMYQEVILVATKAAETKVLSPRILMLAARTFFLTGDYLNCLIALGLADSLLSGAA